MTGSAKQEKNGLLRRFAPRNDEEEEVCHNPLPVIASQRVGAKRRPMTGSTKQSTSQPSVIASVAKQSMSQRKRKSMDCFVASLLAMTV